MGAGDGLDDRQAEAYSRVVGVDALGAALERLGEGRDLVRGERFAGVLDREDRGLGADGGGHPDGAPLGEVVDDRVLHEVRGQLEQECLGAAGGGDVAAGLDGDAVLLREGEEGLGGLFRQEGQVDVFPGEGPLVGAAEQEQCLGGVDRPGVDRVEAVDDPAGVLVRVGTGQVEQGLRDRQRGAQLVGGVGREAPLFGHVGFEPGEHRVEGVGEFAELVLGARQSDAVGERAVRGQPGGLRDAGQRGEHAPGEDPPADQAEHQQEPHGDGGDRSEGAQHGQGVVGLDDEPDVGHPRQEQPRGGEQQDTGEHEEPDVAEGEFEPDAQPGRPIHGRLRRLRPRVACRCGIRRPAPWR